MTYWDGNPTYTKDAGRCEYWEAHSTPIDSQEPFGVIGHRSIERCVLVHNHPGEHLPEPVTEENRMARAVEYSDYIVCVRDGNDGNWEVIRKCPTAKEAMRVSRFKAEEWQVAIVYQVDTGQQAVFEAKETVKVEWV